jgi:hypothetical protein
VRSLYWLISDRYIDREPDEDEDCSLGSCILDFSLGLIGQESFSVSTTVNSSCG